MASSLVPGSILDGKYRIIRLLDTGGMGAVFEAEHLVTNKRVAIKCMRPEQATKPKSADRLVQEARAAARIRHPNVVDVYDIGNDADTIFLVMEYLEGETLTKVMKRGGIPMHQLIGYMLSAMRGVAAAHRQRVVHRDIKPDNIFLANEEDTRMPVPKVLDFGISKLESLGAEPLSLTRSGSSVGTPMYMSLEQLNADRDLDARVDVYAFGVILYEALTGVHPYAANSYAELVVKVVSGRPIAPSELRPEIPLALDRLILWAMERDRGQRIASLDLLIRELEPFTTESGFRAQMISGHVVPMLRPLASLAGASGLDSARESSAFPSGLRGSKTVNPPGAGIGSGLSSKRGTFAAAGMVAVVVLVGSLLAARWATPLPTAASPARRGPPALPSTGLSTLPPRATSEAVPGAAIVSDAHPPEATPPTQLSGAVPRATRAVTGPSRITGSATPSTRTQAELAPSRPQTRKTESGRVVQPIVVESNAPPQSQTGSKPRQVGPRASRTPLPATEFY